MATKTAQPNPTTLTNTLTSDPPSLYSSVQSHYGEAAKSADSAYGHAVASAFGYSKEELTNIPAESNLGLSCGNPFAIANLREGETVIDLGSGAGFDVFQAASKVSGGGKAIGVDMNDEMLSRARSIAQKNNVENASFVKSPVTKIELPDGEADCIISNCVINLVPEPEKQLAFNEMFRLLKPEGRVAISDILLKQDLPDDLKSDVALYVGCIAGASRVEGYERYLAEAGFKDVLIVADQSDLNVYKTASKEKTALGCCSPESKVSGCNAAVKRSSKSENIDLNEWAASFKIYAVKPRS